MFLMGAMIAGLIVGLVILIVKWDEVTTAIGNFIEECKFLKNILDPLLVSMGLLDEMDIANRDKERSQKRVEVQEGGPATTGAFDMASVQAMMAAPGGMPGMPPGGMPKFDPQVIPPSAMMSAAMVPAEGEITIRDDSGRDEVSEEGKPSETQSLKVW